MKLLSVDVGTTSCKAGLFTTQGEVLHVASHQTPTHTRTTGDVYYDPVELWQVVSKTIREVVERTSPHDIALVSIASMAESGLLVDRATGAPRSDFIPWFDMRSAPYAERLQRQDDLLARFCKTGIHASPKVSLAKLLWLHDHNTTAFRNAVWLSAADYIAHQLTGQMATDYTLAGRTYAFRIDSMAWDTDWIADCGLAPDIFPDTFPSGTPVGTVHDSAHAATLLPAGIPVTIAGHDHICAALGAGAVTPATIFDSMGTAEVLLGTLARRDLTISDYQSNLSYGCHVVEGLYYWLGGLSSSGGSIEWLRSLFGKEQLSYKQLDELLNQRDYEPTEILYFPYLLGGSSSSLNRNVSAVRAAFVGLGTHHRQADLVKAVLQGTAYEMERVRRTAQKVMDVPIERVIAAGGGTRNSLWIQIKADVSNCVFDVIPFSEITLLGAAMIAGIGTGIFADVEQAIEMMVDRNLRTFCPNLAQHALFKRLYEHGFLELQTPLNRYYEYVQSQQGRYDDTNQTPQPPDA